MNQTQIKSKTNQISTTSTITLDLTETTPSSVDNITPTHSHVHFVELKLIRNNIELPFEVKAMTSVDNVVTLGRYLTGDCDKERLYVISLNTKNYINAIDLVSIGSIDSAMCDPKSIFKSAILANATGIILIHNHPSGIITPSRADRNVTKRVKELSKLFELRFLDHVIVTDTDDYYSFAQNEDVIC